MTHPSQGEGAAGRSGGEWLWRFVSVALFGLLCWVAWVAYQISPSSLATPAAFQAATRALETQNVKTGVIRPAAAKLHPVNMEKLRLSDALLTPPASEQ